jgi:hypothetical protein
MYFTAGAKCTEVSLGEKIGGFLINLFYGKKRRARSGI